jgi:hypothetical protein
MICEHCQSDVSPKQMAKLSNGDPSRCCLKCWEEFQSSHGRDVNAFPEKWTQDRRAEEEAGCFDPNADTEVVKRTARKLKTNRAEIRS